MKSFREKLADYKAFYCNQGKEAFIGMLGREYKRSEHKTPEKYLNSVRDLIEGYEYTQDFELCAILRDHIKTVELYLTH